MTTTELTALQRADRRYRWSQRGRALAIIFAFCTVFWGFVLPAIVAVIVR